MAAPDAPSNSTPCATSTARRWRMRSNGSDIRPRVEGFAGWDLRCAFPEIGTTIGYALTCTADSTTNSRGDQRGLLRLWEALEAAPQPSVLVIKDIGPDAAARATWERSWQRRRKRGAVGCVSDGGLRDVMEVRALGGFQDLCPGFRRLAREPGDLRRQRRSEPCGAHSFSQAPAARRREWDSGGPRNAWRSVWPTSGARAGDGEGTARIRADAGADGREAAEISRAVHSLRAMVGLDVMPVRARRAAHGRRAPTRAATR